MTSWLNGAVFVTSVPLAQWDPSAKITGTDVLLGDQTDGLLHHRTAAASRGQVTNRTTALPPPPFIATKGSAYCYLPSITALRYLASRNG